MNRRNLFTSAVGAVLAFVVPASASASDKKSLFVKAFPNGSPDMSVTYRPAITDAERALLIHDMRDYEVDGEPASMPHCPHVETAAAT